MKESVQLELPFLNFTETCYELQLQES